MSTSLLLIASAVVTTISAIMGVMGLTLYSRWTKKHYLFVAIKFMVCFIASLLLLLFFIRGNLFSPVVSIVSIISLVSFLFAIILFYKEKHHEKILIPVIIIGATIILPFISTYFHSIVHLLLIVFAFLMYSLGRNSIHNGMLLNSIIGFYGLLSFVGSGAMFFNSEFLLVLYFFIVLCIFFIGFFLYFERILNLLLAISLSSITDPLTKLYNRRYFNQRLDYFVEQEPFVGMIFFDIDNFKKLNDTKGHDVGDKALQQVANIVKEVVSDIGVAGRYGGEEIVAFIYGDSISTPTIAEKIRKRIEEETIVTVSVGYSESYNNLTPKELVLQADQAMYKAKNSGKNKVCSI